MARRPKRLVALRQAEAVAVHGAWIARHRLSELVASLQTDQPTTANQWARFQRRLQEVRSMNVELYETHARALTAMRTLSDYRIARAKREARKRWPTLTTTARVHRRIDWDD